MRGGEIGKLLSVRRVGEVRHQTGGEIVLKRRSLVRGQRVFTKFQARSGFGEGPVLILVSMICNPEAVVTARIAISQELMPACTSDDCRCARAEHQARDQPDAPLALLILLAMMESFSCSPLIFFVLKEIVAWPQPKLMSG